MHMHLVAIPRSVNARVVNIPRQIEMTHDDSVLNVASGLPPTPFCYRIIAGAKCRSEVFAFAPFRSVLIFYIFVPSLVGFKFATLERNKPNVVRSGKKYVYRSEER